MSGERQKRIKRALAAVFGAAAVLVVLYILRPPCLVRKVFGVLVSFLRNDTDDRSAFAIGLCRCVGAIPFMLFFLPFALLWGVLEAGAVCKEQTAAAF